MPETEHFKISTGLKDLIGRDLIVDDFVAVFELVKNSFDAHASRVDVHFDEDRVIIADNGKGMSRDDITGKWLFVAYSAKKDGTEDANYREKIGFKQRPFAGAKGVGRFSCDRLGNNLTLYSKYEGSTVQHLSVDWTLYEKDALQEFTSVDVLLEDSQNFPDDVPAINPQHGTVLVISNLRSQWDRKKLTLLRQELSKLIDPFSDEESLFEINLIAPQELEADKADEIFNASRTEERPARLIVNGRVTNPIIDVLGRRTTSVKIRLIENGSFIETTLEDRGDLIYKIREKNTFPGLAGTELRADIFYLNHSAKIVFHNRMGLPAVQYGSIFLFRNGFRVVPIGATDDDFFGLSQRKQQGQKRYLGARDLIGRVDIKGARGFNEATSRNHGLIATPETAQLITFVLEKCIRRLERYVVDISWKDKFDKNADDTSRMYLDESSSLIAQLVARLSATEGIELIAYNENLVRIVNEKSDAFETSLKALELLAEKTGNKDLIARVEAAKARIKALEIAEAEAREAERRAMERAALAEKVAAQVEVQYEQERARNAFLVAASSLDEDTILNLHHQIMMHAADVNNEVLRMMKKINMNADVTTDDWVDFLDLVSFRNSQILAAARYATKGGYKQQATDIRADLSNYIDDHIRNISSLWSPRGLVIDINTDGKEFTRSFKPIDISILLDNLISNAGKALATRMVFNLSVTKGMQPELKIEVADDGNGWPGAIAPLERVLEKGVTTSTNGSGLGLHHVNQVVNSLRGVVELIREPFSDDYDGAHIIVRIPS